MKVTIKGLGCCLKRPDKQLITSWTIIYMNKKNICIFGLFHKLTVYQFSCKQELQTQVETRPAQSCRWWRTHIFKCKSITLHLLNLSHMMVNSEIRGTSLSCPLWSWVLLRCLKIRLTKEWSFPWAIFRIISWCVREKAHLQSNRFQTEDQWVIMASCMHCNAWLTTWS